MFPVLLPTPRVRGAAERDPLVARLRAFGFRVSTATFFSNLRISRFHRVESHRPTRNLLVKRPKNLWATVINPRANECRSHQRTPRDGLAPSASHRRGTFTFRPSHRCLGSRRARRVRRAAPPVAAPSFAARSPRASRAASTPTPSRRTRRRDGRRRSRHRCGAKIAEPRGPTGASMSCSCRCVRVPGPVPSTTTTTASRDPDPNARENPRSPRRPPARPKTRARRTKIT